ncbi:hypothetical protein JCM19235_1941 [Vibrio maritimus]|uniref:HNH domain-containing protein n=1 Tax=Vibrio maritimus TaxID=990268 RepID=A0A090RVF9_9VIBR|nr:hypothetical protein JCM19235_1941 [Vibrio maritimus]
MDHIIPISAGGEFNDPENLQCICEACHKVKTAKEARRK